jgi:hypothetical protein
MKDRYMKQEPLEMVISIWFGQNIPQGELGYKINTAYWTVLSSSRSSVQEQDRRDETGYGPLTEFVHGASKSGCVEDIACYCSSNLLKCYKYVFVHSPGDCQINRFTNPEIPVITCHITRIHDNT